MPVLAGLLAALAALVHVWIFVLESVLFMRPSTWRAFRIRSTEDASIVRPMAFNQGFYNLFLAVEIAIGLALVARGDLASGSALVLFGCASMVAAAAVLISTDRGFVRAAAIQAGFPLLALLAAALM
jgi:putative membrane protein